MRLFEGTEWDRPPRCERCDELEEECACPAVEVERTSPQEQTALLAVEKRRKGKFVTVVRRLIDEGSHLSELLTRLKSVCGAGGTIKEGAIEIQGRQLDQVRTELQRLGYRTKG